MQSGWTRLRSQLDRTPTLTTCKRGAYASTLNNPPCIAERRQGGGRWPQRRWRSQHCKWLLSRNVKRFRGGLVFKAHRRLHHSTLGWRVIKKKRRRFSPGDRKGTEAYYVSMYTSTKTELRSRMLKVLAVPGRECAGNSTVNEHLKVLRHVILWHYERRYGHVGERLPLANGQHSASSRFVLVLTSLPLKSILRCSVTLASSIKSGDT